MNELLADPTMRLYLLCASILVLKMWVLGGPVMVVLRNVKGVFITPEDYAMRGREPGPPDEQIERIRAAHRNDLENILPFLVVGFLAAKSGAVSYTVARWLFIPYTVARVLHTLMYTFRRQPWRSIFFGIGDFALFLTTVLLLIAVLRAAP